MAYSAAELRMVDDHITQGERHVTRQEALVAWLGSRGHPTEVAEELLAEFRLSLANHRAHRSMMLSAQEKVADPLRPSAPAVPPVPLPPLQD